MAKQSKRDVEKHMPMVGMDHRETDTENFENGVRSMVDSPGASPPPPNHPLAITNTKYMDFYENLQLKIFKIGQVMTLGT